MFLYPFIVFQIVLNLLLFIFFSSSMPRSKKKIPPSVASCSSSSMRPPLKPPFYSQETTPAVIIQRAIASAKRHDINLCHGSPNSSDGNCAFESVIFNVNDRECFSEFLPFSPDHYRRIWLTDFKNKAVNDCEYLLFSRMGRRLEGYDGVRCL